MDNNKRFAELVGVDPSCSDRVMGCSSRIGGKPKKQCAEIGCDDLIYPDFTDAREVIKAMRGRKDFHIFQTNLITNKLAVGDSITNYWCGMFTDTTGLLRDEAIKFLEEKR